jgi:hypothetical protein
VHGRKAEWKSLTGTNVFVAVVFMRGGVRLQLSLQDAAPQSRFLDFARSSLDKDNLAARNDRGEKQEDQPVCSAGRWARSRCVFQAWRGLGTQETGTVSALAAACCMVDDRKRYAQVQASRTSEVKASSSPVWRVHSRAAPTVA